MSWDFVLFWGHANYLPYSANAGFDLFDDDERDDSKRLNASVADASDFIVDIREWDVPYHVRVMIDQGKNREKYLRGFG